MDSLHSNFAWSEIHKFNYFTNTQKKILESQVKRKTQKRERRPIARNFRRKHNFSRQSALRRQAMVRAHTSKSTVKNINAKGNITSHYQERCWFPLIVVNFNARNFYGRSSKVSMTILQQQRKEEKVRKRQILVSSLIFTIQSQLQWIVSTNFCRTSSFSRNTATKTCTLLNYLTMSPSTSNFKTSAHLSTTNLKTIYHLKSIPSPS